MEKEANDEGRKRRKKEQNWSTSWIKKVTNFAKKRRSSRWRSTRFLHIQRFQLFSPSGITVFQLHLFRSTKAYGKRETDVYQLLFHWFNCNFVYRWQFKSLPCVYETLNSNHRRIYELYKFLFLSEVSFSDRIVHSTGSGYILHDFRLLLQVRALLYATPHEDFHSDGSHLSVLLVRCFVTAKYPNLERTTIN